MVTQWITDYVRAQQAAHASIPAEAVAGLVELFRDTLKSGHNVFVFGNGGSAANASHFATDLGKGASDKIGKRFRVLSLNDNVSWMTALGNDYAYDDVFVGQLQNYGRPGDIAFSISVSGNSPNCVKALEWARKSGLRTVALVGAKRGRMAEIAEQRHCHQRHALWPGRRCADGHLPHALLRIHGASRMGCLSHTEFNRKERKERRVAEPHPLARFACRCHKFLAACEQFRLLQCKSPETPVISLRSLRSLRLIVCAVI